MEHKFLRSKRIALLCQEILRSTAATKASTGCRLNAPGWFLPRPGHTLSSCVHLLCQKTVYPKYGQIWHNLVAFGECKNVYSVKNEWLNRWSRVQDSSTRPKNVALGEADAATLQVRWINVQLSWNAIMKPCRYQNTIKDGGSTALLTLFTLFPVFLLFNLPYTAVLK